MDPFCAYVIYEQSCMDETIKFLLWYDLLYVLVQLNRAGDAMHLVLLYEILVIGNKNANIRRRVISHHQIVMNAFDCEVVIPIRGHVVGIPW